MGDEHITVPDFIPGDLAEEHAATARRQVRAAFGSGRRGQPAPTRPAQPECAPGSVRCGLGDWLSERDRRLIGGGAVLVMVGLATLTAFWIWVAVTMHPAGWALAVLGAALSTANGITAVRIWRLSVRHSPHRTGALGDDAAHEQSPP